MLYVHMFQLYKRILLKNLVPDFTTTTPKLTTATGF